MTKLPFMSVSRTNEFVSFLRTDPVPNLGGWQFDPKPAPFSRFRFHTNFPTHALHTFAHDRQSDARARITRPVRALKHAKHPLVLIPRDANALILNPQPAPVSARLRPKTNMRACLRFDEL